MTIIKQTGVQSSGHMKNLRGYINDDRKVILRDSLNMDGCTNPKRWAHHMWMTREAYGHNKAARRVRDGVTEGNLCRGGRDYRLQRRIRPRIPFRRRGAPERGCTHHGHHEPVHVVHGKALQAGGCRRPHRIRVDGQGARVACRRARDACRAAMARTMARSRVDTCLGRVKRCFSHALIFAA